MSESCELSVASFVADKSNIQAGTGAIGLEALSRGATKAVLIERHVPTVRIVESNVQTLELESQAKVVTSDTFFWVRQFLNDPDSWPVEPWAVFCCPPYVLFEDNRDDLLITMHSMAHENRNHQ